MASEDALRCRLHEISVERPRFGYRRVTGQLRLEGWKVNRKRIQRLWREEGLRVAQRQPKRRRVGESAFPAKRLRAEHPNDVWAIDFIFDATTDGRPIKALSMCDEFTRENLVRRIGRSITAQDVVEALDEAAARRGAPKFVRCDNGPEFIANAIKRWCLAHETQTSYIDPGAPWQNPFVESFNARVRDELFAREVFDSILEAQVLFDDWGEDYNRYRVHSSLGYLPPAVFAQRYNEAKLS